MEAIRYFTVAGPDEFLLLTPERARALGIDIFERDSTNVTSLAQAPTVDTYADRFVSYDVLRSRCSVFFQMDDAIVKRESMSAIKSGQQVAGSDGEARGI